uniref:Ptl2 protein n=1 Tax=Antirrhinum majus x Antirrhinum hispanicum TaxID=51610 RepID=Q38792_9LAMI|nr:Ptl2 [Antirrhinum majus x Antirrhinum hispanicum]
MSAKYFIIVLFAIVLLTTSSFAQKLKVDGVGPAAVDTPPDGDTYPNGKGGSPKPANVPKTPKAPKAPKLPKAPTPSPPSDEPADPPRSSEDEYYE